ncbi:unnamed protein product (macronuclear) [Paramecium tetraurelia]|uniref:BRO1 domain-containing protein n=1 Tax=Paramecium tetraurelia TaxID=5888 RepID=A0EFW3_PARTE|nr:uncharacterized protein GSPATT00026527001 [Paramecium tetraurelia]CAK94204.1 unnamed protein product [Paramecium tetraurelia]|eukprot:XP_001461577.1 hypothetical protein (macronuclear) [Paramecium tetraurelia strain d4-2]
MNNQQTISNNSKQEQQPEEESYDEEDDEDLQEYTQSTNLKQLFNNQDSFMQQINLLNEQATAKIKQQKHKEALKLLQQSEQMLEFAASCGRVIDRNLIIIILYNQACAYQCQWILDKCSKYLDGVIYNMEIGIKEDEQDLQTLANIGLFGQSLFTIYCNTESIRKQALINSQKAAQTMRELFKIANSFYQQWLQVNGSQETATTSQSIVSMRNDSSHNLDKKKKGQTYQLKDEIEFGRLVIDSASDVLKDMIKQEDLSSIRIDQKQLLRETKRQLYNWRNNPENNEKSVRKELKLVTQNEEYRSLLGIQNLADWIKNFNIGSIMHMAPQIYEDFTSFGEMIFELAKRQLLEKVIYLSISYFTIATELRFVELEKAKQHGLKDDKIDTEEFKLSELYHLKSIEIACRHIAFQSPYISHLITSYHKHYNINLDVIREESLQSNASEKIIEEQEQSKVKGKMLQIQINRELPNSKFEKQDQSPKLTGNFIKSFLNSRSPPKQSQQQSVKNLISDTVKIQTNLLEQMINKKRGSDSSPTNQRNPAKQQNQADFDFSVYLKKQSNPCNTSNLNTDATSDIINSVMTFQLQPYKNNTIKCNLTNMLKQQSPTNNNNTQLKSLLSDACRTERQVMTEQQNSYTPISYRVNNRSPDSSYLNAQKQRQQQLHQNKTPQNRPRTNTEQQYPQPSFPLKLETIQQLLKSKAINNQKIK